jgi:hypothetical protein
MVHRDGSKGFDLSERAQELRDAKAWGEGFVLASRRLQNPYPMPVVELDNRGLPILVEDGPDVAACTLYQERNPQCPHPAGKNTSHPGTGTCATHGGNSQKERVGGAFVMAHAFAEIMDVDPWEAVEVVLRRAYAWSSWYQAKLATVTDDDDLRPGGAAWDWVKGARDTADMVARFAKLCHDMGIAERRMQQIESQGQMIAQVLATTLHEMGLSEADEDRARMIMDTQLRALSQQADALIVRGELAG